GDLVFAHDLAAPVEDADAASFQGYIDADKVLHGRVPLMLEADPFGPRTTIILGGGHPCRQPRWRPITASVLLASGGESRLRSFPDGHRLRPAGRHVGT